MKKYSLIFYLFFIFVLLFASTAKAESATVRLKATADAFISSGQPNTNVSSGNLAVSNSFSPDVVTKSLIKFDLTQIPIGATINSANFGVVIAGCSAPGSQPVLTVRRLISVWSETTVTWSTNIRTTDTGMTGPLESTCAFENSVDFNVKDIVQAWASGASNYGFIISGAESQVYEQYYFSRDQAMLYPYLEISYSYTPASTTPTGGTTGNNSTGSGVSSGTSSGSNSGSSSQPPSGNATTSTTSGENSNSDATNSKTESEIVELKDAAKNPITFVKQRPLWQKIVAGVYLLLFIAGVIIGLVAIIKNKSRKNLLKKEKNVNIKV